MINLEHQVIDLTTSPPSSPSRGAYATVFTHKRRRTINVNNEGNQTSGDQVDRISNLPDDILIHILSFLDLKTAGRTSLLSKRWRHLWTHRNDLDFEDSEYYSQLQLTPNDSAIENYVNWVNKVTSTNRASHLSSFRIHSPLNAAHNDYIHKWVKFALTKNVESLELNLSNVYGYKIGRDSPLIRWSNYKDHLTTLRSLHLEGLTLKEPKVLEKVLGCCSNLECLTVKACHFHPPTLLKTARIRSATKERLVISSFKLKQLEIRDLSPRIETLEISAPKLTTFTLFTFKSAVVEYTSVPSLVEASFGGPYSYSVYNDSSLISDFSYRLQKLSITWCRDTTAPSESTVYRHDSFLFLISLIKACPLLHTFKLKLFPSTHYAMPMSAIEEVVKGIKYIMRHAQHHQRLEVLEIVGFDRSASIAEFAICVAQIAPMLNKIVCDPHCPQTKGNIHKFIDIQNAHGIDPARRHAKLLTKHFRRGIRVVIL